MKRRMNFSALLTVGALLATHVVQGAVNDCDEPGPFYNQWQCLTSGTVSNAGSLTFTNLNVLTGQSIVPPSLATLPVIGNGTTRFYENYYCTANPNNQPYNKWLTNQLKYFSGDLQFSPSVPSIITNASTNSYTAYTYFHPLSVVGWWPGQTNGNELVHGNTAILTNSATYAAGKVGQGFYMDGVNDYVYVPYSSNLDVGRAKGFTLECWLNPKDTNQQRPIFEWRTAGGQIGVHLWHSVGTTNFGNLYANIVALHGLPHTFSSSPGLVQTNTWQHVALTYDHTSGAANIYLNGTQVAATNLGVFSPDTTGTLYLGKRPGGDTFRGTIDEPTIYNCALEASDIAAIYNADSAGKKWNGSPAYGVALPVGCLCSSISNFVGHVTVRVFGEADKLNDTDGDGVDDYLEVALGRNPFAAGTVPDSGGTLNLRVFTRSN